MKELLRSILSLKHLRQLYVSLKDAYSPIQAKRAFVEMMNEKSKMWGLTSTTWLNPSGLAEDGNYSSTTARDLAILGTHVMDYPALLQMYQGKKSYNVHVTQPYIYHPRKHDQRRICSTMRFHKVGGKYPILFGKTGSGDGYNTLLVICKMPDNTYISAAILQADSAEKRFDAMNELLWVIRNGEGKVCSAKCACAYSFVPEASPHCIYSQNADEPSAPMSTTKVMSLMVCMDYMNDLSRPIYIRPSDVIGDEGSDVFGPWDKSSTLDIMYAALLPSSNRSANALARECGYLILNNTHKHSH